MKRTWAVVDASTQTLTAVGTPIGQDLLVNVKTNLDLIPHGVTASAIRLRIGMSLLGNENGLIDVSYGVLWLSTAAVLAGAFPDPAEESADWMAFGSRILEIPEGQVAARRKVYDFDLHSDSMRKQGNAKAELVFIAGLALTTVTSVSLHISGRVLLLGL